MIQIYADGALTYDSRLPGYDLLGLTIDTGLNKGGAAYIQMPPGHPAFRAFTSYRTVVEIYRDGVMLFRGRALYPSDDFLRRRTITCEGERCFLRDAVIRPYVYQDNPAAIFADIIGLYNAQVEAFKQFAVGAVTVTDPNNYIRLENETAENADAVIDKLVERCGGYIVFTANDNGQRVINWYADIGYSNNQVIEFGENLLDYASTDENTDLATVIVPYGARSETSGTRVTVESVNGGLDYIQDPDAVALRGVISKAVYWDDITDPANLLTKAQQYLAQSRQIITTLTLTAVDLSVLDKNIDGFRVGDLIRVRSAPHGVDDTYRLTERSFDLLNPENDKVTLGKSIASLSGSSASAERQTTNDLQRVERTVKADYDANVAATIEETRATLTSLIQQTSDTLRLEVSEQYATQDELTAAISTSMTQLADSFTSLLNQLQTTVDANDAEARTQLSEIKKYIRFEDGNIVLGESGNEITLRIENDRISFLDNGAEVAYFSNKRLVVLDGNFLSSLQIGGFAFIPQGNGNLSLTKVG